MGNKTVTNIIENINAVCSQNVDIRLNSALRLLNNPKTLTTHVKWIRKLKIVEIQSAFFLLNLIVHRGVQTGCEHCGHEPIIVVRHVRVSLVKQILLTNYVLENTAACLSVLVVSSS